MLRIHAGQGGGGDLGRRFVACFLQAADGAGLPEDPASCNALPYIEAAMAEATAYAPAGTAVAANLPMPQWS